MKLKLGCEVLRELQLPVNTKHLSYSNTFYLACYFFSQHPKYGHGTVVSEKNVAGISMMRVSKYEQSFSTFSTAFRSASEINQSELDVQSDIWSDKVLGQTNQNGPCGDVF